MLNSSGPETKATILYQKDDWGGGGVAFPREDKPLGTTEEPLRYIGTGNDKKKLSGANITQAQQRVQLATLITSLCLAALLGGASDDANAIWMARGLSGSCHRNACHDRGGRMCQPMLLCASTWQSLVSNRRDTRQRGRERGRGRLGKREGTREREAGL